MCKIEYRHAYAPRVKDETMPRDAIEVWYVGGSANHSSNTAANAIRDAQIKAERLAKIAMQKFNESQAMKSAATHTNDSKVHFRTVRSEGRAIKADTDANNQSQKAQRLEKKLNDKNRKPPTGTSGGSSASSSSSGLGAATAKRVADAGLGAALVAAAAAVASQVAKGGVLGWFLAPAGA